MPACTRPMHPISSCLLAPSRPKHSLGCKRQSRHACRTVAGIPAFGFRPIHEVLHPSRLSAAVGLHHYRLPTGRCSRTRHHRHMPSRWRATGLYRFVKACGVPRAHPGTHSGHPPLNHMHAHPRGCLDDQGGAPCAGHKTKSGRTGETSMGVDTVPALP